MCKFANGWIATDEAQPDKGQKVDLWMSNGERFTNMIYRKGDMFNDAYWEEEGGLWTTKDGNFTLDDITAWKPILGPHHRKSN
jgi:hypothetical protein